MPRAAPLSAPSMGDPDRKRVLNVLAQRRYRQRKREKIAILEQQAKSTSPASAESSSSPDSNSENSSGETHIDSYASGVSLSLCSSDGIYIDTLSALDNCDVNLTLGALSESQDLNDGFNFTNHLMPIIPQQAFGVYQPTPSIPMDTDMEVPVLKTMKAGTLVAQALGCQDLIWNPTSQWTITTPTLPGLPPNMQPTPAQLSIPHHPLFDILPWPELRTKLICVFALPEQHRPENARGPMAVIQVAYDIDDDVEGFRINGEGIEKDDWEVGEAFFKNWWWALDRTIIETSNAWRQKRGQSRLTLKAA